MVGPLRAFASLFSPEHTGCSLGHAPGGGKSRILIVPHAATCDSPVCEPWQDPICDFEKPRRLRTSIPHPRAWGRGSGYGPHRTTAPGVSRSSLPCGWHWQDWGAVTVGRPGTGAPSTRGGGHRGFFVPIGAPRESRMRQHIQHLATGETPHGTMLDGDPPSSRQHRGSGTKVQLRPDGRENRPNAGQTHNKVKRRDRHSTTGSTPSSAAPDDSGAPRLLELVARRSAC